MHVHEAVVRASLKCPHCKARMNTPLGCVTHGKNTQCPLCRRYFEVDFQTMDYGFPADTFSDIHPDAFMHTLDKGATTALRKVPGMDLAVRKMVEHGYEKWFRIDAMANNVKVTKKTCGYIHEMAQSAAACLGIAMPDMFIKQHPFPNAMTTGIKYPMMVIHSGLIDLMTCDELYCVIGHEMGHIKCHHVLYHMVASFLNDFADLMGAAGYVLLPIKLALLEWHRKSELSADRASLLVSGDRGTVVNVLMKLAGGSQQIADMIDETEFVTQAAQFEQLTSGVGLNKFYRVLANIGQSHPFPAVRAKEINEWAASREWWDIRAGHYRTRSQNADAQQLLKCPHCSLIIEALTPHCIGCGQNLVQLSDQYAEECPGALTEAFNSVKLLFGKSS